MSEDEELEQFKQEFTKQYIDTYLDRLLDVRNAVKKATSFDEVKELMEKEKKWLEEEFGLSPVRREKDATEREEKPDTAKE